MPEGGVDVLCFGGTKNGMFWCAEAGGFFDRTLSGEFAYRCKQAGQFTFQNAAGGGTVGGDAGASGE